MLRRSISHGTKVLGGDDTVTSAIPLATLFINAGYKVDDPLYAKDSRVKLLGYSAAALSAAGTYTLFKRIVDKILLSRNPNRTKLFDQLSPTDLVKPKLSWKEVWAAFGVNASKSAVKAFGQVHGLHLVSSFIAIMWAVMIAPFVQSRAECLMIPKGEPKEWGRTRKLREQNAVQELRNTVQSQMPRAAQP